VEWEDKNDEEDEPKIELDYFQANFEESLFQAKSSQGCTFLHELIIASGIASGRK
jgi:hypothetical protein